MAHVCREHRHLRTFQRDASTENSGDAEVYEMYYGKMHVQTDIYIYNPKPKRNSWSRKPPPYLDIQVCRDTYTDPCMVPIEDR